ncbi:hypothetical protein PHMEG_0006815 [Phytophthora megakarya]|uniref:Uncharacterized protein n=1 Tax=Phytophthora megakarya TaxID=4795 RepID=A0A225WPU0_9STRA|nr:hypothetical protein PHMEG_0006815 [Phytophthora megakarya]
MTTRQRLMDTPVSPRGETAQDLGGNLGETAQERGETAQDNGASTKRLQVVDVLRGSISDSDRPSVSAVGYFNARNAAQNLLSTWLAKSTFLTELDQADAKAHFVIAATRSAAGQVPPVQITSPPSYSPCSTTQFVGIEYLSDQDRSDLSELLSEDQDIQRELLMPRDASVELSPSDFRDMITGIPTQRELAALLRVYEPQGLARRVFGMSTLLKRMLDKHRVSLQAQRRLSESDRDFNRATEEHNRQEQVLRDENAELQRQIEDYRLVNRQLEDRLRGGTFKVGRVMNFLNHHNARMSGNWPRLKALLEKFKDGSLPPDAWKTQIHINAADEFDADPGVYKYEVESDDEESKVPEVPKPQVTLKVSTVDLTEPSSSESTPAKIQRKLFGESKPKAFTDFQLRPSTYTLSTTDTLDLMTAKQLSVTKAREGLTQLVIWDKLRTDIQELMRSHMSYDEALAAARTDAEIHSHLDARHLVSMLVRIIYWKSLDKTPWIKYVPCWCYKGAESKLAKALTSGEVSTRWPNLRKDIQDDAVEIMVALYGSVTEEEDDEGPKCDRDYTSDSSSNNKPKSASSPPKKRAKSGNGKMSRPGQERKQTDLARKSYDSPSDSEKWIVEVPGRGILSWRHHGVLMKFPPGTANTVTQSFGFPDYAPNLPKDEDVQALRERWDPVAFKELMDTDLSLVARESLDAIVAFMSVHRRTDDPYSVELHRERKAECDKAKKEYNKLLDDLSMLSHVKDDGTRYTLNEQMELLDDQDLARVQWNTCASDEDRIKHLSEDYQLKLLKGSQRQSQKNRVTMDFD